MIRVNILSINIPILMNFITSVSIENVLFKYETNSPNIPIIQT